MNSKNIAPEKQAVFDYLDSNAEALAGLGDSIFYFAELGMQEFETVDLMTNLLGDAGFAIEREVSGFPTAFIASYGSGRPVIAIHTEYDANPKNSQRSGVPEQSEIEPGAPGHCEGHNVNAAVMVSAALSIKKQIDASGLTGTIRIIGAPAEEQLLSRPYFVRDGHFDDVDVAFHDHVDSEFKSDYGLMQTAVVSAEFIFHGEPAHAAKAPWKGRDALDAVMLMDTGMAQYREHMEPTMTAHRVITDGGDQPNVIPARAAVWWYFRGPTADIARRLFEQGKRIAEGAALMTNTELEIDVRSAVWPVRANQTLAEIVQRNAELIGMPEWSEMEQQLARTVQEKVGVEAVGLRPATTPLKGPSAQIAASNDCGDVSWVVPMGRVRFPANIPNIGYHHWAAGVSLATSIAHKGGLAGAKALAASVIDLLLDPDLVDAAKGTFKEELGGVAYESLLPPGQKPPLELNRSIMEKFRPAMRNHYLKDAPRFT
ncbi:MAG: amidohydrolase [Pseudomonadota bacterium]|nr:amidohydrolase [Pseudomonadota bacterium]